jgi:hypothetical protein
MSRKDMRIEERTVSLTRIEMNALLSLLEGPWDSRAKFYGKGGLLRKLLAVRMTYSDGGRGYTKWKDSQP